MVVVGVDEDLNQLRSRLTSARKTELDVIPIVGMGGMGKTTLARILYDKYSSSSKPHFDRYAWVRVSQTYDPQQILNTILACVTGKPLMEIPQQQTNELIVTVYQILLGRRYLIVLDDNWSYKAWDDVQRAFAREKKGSRVIFTIRENSLADYVKSNGHEMHLINEDQSWELLRRKVFCEESCPRGLEEVGKSIALRCGGLPLALQVIGGLLANSEKSKGFWEYVAHNISSFIEKTDDQFAGIFSWSFSHLPHYLKPCFLYMGAFPEDYEISSSRIIRMWVTEAFLRPVTNKSLEEAAEMHLSALVNRNLIFVRTRKSNGKPKSYGIHDLLRDLCLRKAQEKKFLYVKDLKTDILLEDILCIPRVSVHSRNEAGTVYDYGSFILTPFSRSFLLTGSGKSEEFVSRLCSKSSVLDVYQSPWLVSQEVFLHLFNLSLSWQHYVSTSVLPRFRSSGEGDGFVKAFEKLTVPKLGGLEENVDDDEVKWALPGLKGFETQVSSFCPPQDFFLTSESLGLDTKSSYSLDNSQGSFANRTSAHGQRRRNSNESAGTMASRRQQRRKQRKATSAS